MAVLHVALNATALSASGKMPRHPRLWTDEVHMQAWPAITCATAHAPTVASSSTTLHAFAPPLAFRPRTPLPCRIVIVGASTTGLSALQAIIADDAYSTPFISLLAPNGACGAAALSEPHLEAASHAQGVTVMDASMESLDPCVPTITVAYLSHAVNIASQNIAIK
jgi:hypothetical protein